MTIWEVVLVGLLLAGNVAQLRINALNNRAWKLNTATWRAHLSLHAIEKARR